MSFCMPNGFGRLKPVTGERSLLCSVYPDPMDKLVKDTVTG